MTTATAHPTWATTYTRLALDALPADLSTATPPQVDEAIRTLELDGARQGENIRRAAESLHRAVGHEHRRVTRGIYRWYDAQGREVDSDDAIAAAQAGEGPSCDARRRADGLAEVAAARAAMVAIRNRIMPLHAEYTRRPWARYYRVHNSNGHVHTDMNCRTTYNTTPWAWPTQLSGADPATVVDAAGPLTCLVCFPTEREDILAARPVQFDMFETTEQRAERTKREEAAAARKAEKIAKGITPDGSPLVVQEPRFSAGRTNPVEIKTERAAELRYVEFAAQARAKWLSRFQQDIYAASAETLLAALATKRGTDVETERAKYAKKVDRKAAQN